MSRAVKAPWLLFIHQIPKDPAYLRVKIGRRLSAVGAVAIKNSVYALPNTDGCREDFSWLRREIVDGGGEAGLFEASAVEGLVDDDLERMFRDARVVDYQRLSDKLREFEASGHVTTSHARQALLSDISRIEEQLGEIERIDFFSQHEAALLRGRLKALRQGLEQRNSPVQGAERAGRLPIAEYQGRTWLTREGVKVDRVACAWLIRRFIDKKPKFRFVDQARHVPKKGELRFDMPEGEFTHEGDLCSFEVMCRRFGLASPGLMRIAEIIHDLDIKDGRYGHPETEGVRVLIQGLIAQHSADGARIDSAAALFDALFAADQGKSAKPKR